MRAVKTLPAGYAEAGKIDLDNNRVALFWLNVAGLVLLFPTGWLLWLAVFWLRPDFRMQGTVSGGEFFLLIAAMLVALVVMVVVHEAIHGIFFWLFTRERPVFGFKGWYAYAAAPGWYIPRAAYFVAALAPLVLMTLGGLALLPLVPEWLLLVVLFIVWINAVGAVGDIAVVGWLLLQPASVLAQDLGDAVILYRPEATG